VNFILQIFRRNGLSVKTSLILASLACLVRLAFPGDAPFLGDEAMLLGRAWSDNAAGVMTTHGLTGSRGTDYGPLPILFYRGLLAVTHDPLTLVLLKTAIVSGLTLLAVFWVLRRCPELPPASALFAFFSPYFWFYSRDLWDNTLNIALTALAFAAYLEFLHGHRKRFFGLAAVLATFSLLVHLMALPLCGAFVLHLALREREWLRRHTLFFLCTAAACVLICWPYLAHLLSASRPPVPIAPGWGMLHVVFGALGGRLFTAVGYEYFLGAYWYLKAPLAGLGIGAVAMAASSLGGLLPFLGLREAIRQKDSATPAAWVALAALSLHLTLVCIQQLINHPHYYGSVWIAYFYLLGLGWQALKSPFWRRAVPVSLAGLGFAWLWAIAAAHFGVGASQAHYGPKLSDQVELAKTRCEAQLSAELTPASTLQRLVCP
jgi:hypothetical protein